MEWLVATIALVIGVGVGLAMAILRTGGRRSDSLLSKTERTLHEAEARAIEKATSYLEAEDHSLESRRLDAAAAEERIARREEQIAASMRLPLNGDESGLIGYWRFDEGEGNHAGDLTGNHDGEVVGATRHPTSVCDP